MSGVLMAESDFWFLVEFGFAFSYRNAVPLRFDSSSFDYKPQTYGEGRYFFSSRRLSRDEVC